MSREQVKQILHYRSEAKMRSVVSLIILAIANVAGAGAQVLTPMEVSDPKYQHLQQRHLQALMEIGSEIQEHKFPYPFYFSRVLDVDFDKMQVGDQRSIQFAAYQNQTVLEITGNYYASYSTALMNPYQRLKETFQQVIMPILRSEVSHFPDDSELSAFAIEVSHHVRHRAMGVNSEGPENIAVIIPVTAAQKLVDAGTDDQRQAAALEASVFVNGEPYALWLQDGAPSEEWKERSLPVMRTAAAHTTTVTDPPAAATGSPSASSRLVNASLQARIISPAELAKLQASNEDVVERLVHGVGQEAHFLPYAAPSFVAFRQGTYLQLPIATTLDGTSEASRYKLAALAFDEHVSHLVHAVLDYFPQTSDFDGVSFSSIVRSENGSRSLAVEFFFPFRTMKCFATFDCTGQQLINSGTVVINGERAALDLEVAEGKN
jgi:hypothetical protein